MTRRLLLASLLMLALPHAANAMTLWAATTGVDAAQCGSLTMPCRSINKALALAHDGDTIIVLPGRYGAPEETPAPGCPAPCLVNVNKRVTVTSRDGASSVLLDGVGGAITDVVDITADGVVFGRRGRGLTLMRGANGLNLAAGVSRVTVMGNVATANTSNGFVIQGDHAVVSGNRATGNGLTGFTISDTAHTLTGNYAAGNSIGVGTSPAAIQGFGVSGTDHELTGNIATDNFNGFTIDGSNNHLSGNAAIANGGPGVLVIGDTGLSFVRGSIYGNGSRDTGGIPGCGILSFAPGAVDATGNFWGAATGPGTDPADRVCAVTGSVTTAPFATREIRVRAP